MSTFPDPSKPTVNDLASGEWKLDPEHSSVEFGVPHFWGLVTVKGHFERYEGSVDLQREPAVELTIDADSIETGNRRRDNHLRSGDFFDAVNHPQVRFVSDSAELQGDTLKVHGQLQAGGSEIPLELDARIQAGDSGLEVEAEAQATHRDLGMTFSPLGMTRPHSKLTVKGRLVSAAADGQ